MPVTSALSGRRREDHEGLPAFTWAKMWGLGSEREPASEEQTESRRGGCRTCTSSLSKYAYCTYIHTDMQTHTWVSIGKTFKQNVVIFSLCQGGKIKTFFFLAVLGWTWSLAHYTSTLPTTGTMYASSCLQHHRRVGRKLSRNWISSNNE